MTPETKRQLGELMQRVAALEVNAPHARRGGGRRPSAVRLRIVEVKADYLVCCYPARLTARTMSGQTDQDAVDIIHVAKDPHLRKTPWSDGAFLWEGELWTAEYTTTDGQYRTLTNVEDTDVTQKQRVMPAYQGEKQVSAVWYPGHEIGVMSCPNGAGVVDDDGNLLYLMEAGGLANHAWVETSLTEPEA